MEKKSKTKRKLKMPSSFSIIIGIIILVSILSYILPGGAYEYVDPNAEKVVGERTTIMTRAMNGEELDLLMLLSMAQVGRKTSYTAFIQNQTVDLF